MKLCHALSEQIASSDVSDLEIDVLYWPDVSHTVGFRI